MRKFQKGKVINEVNILIERRYLQEKGLINELSPETRTNASQLALKAGRDAQGERMGITAGGLNRRDKETAVANAQKEMDQQYQQFYGKNITFYIQEGNNVKVIASEPIKQVMKVETGVFQVFTESGNIAYNPKFDQIFVAYKRNKGYTLDRNGANIIQKIIKIINPDSILAPQNGSMGKIVGIQLSMPAQQP